jgi:hypothetical protein
VGVRNIQQDISILLKSSFMEKQDLQLKYKIGLLFLSIAIPVVVALLFGVNFKRWVST